MRCPEMAYRLLRMRRRLCFCQTELLPQLRSKDGSNRIKILKTWNCDKKICGKRCMIEKEPDGETYFPVRVLFSI